MSPDMRLVVEAVMATALFGLFMLYVGFKLGLRFEDRYDIEQKYNHRRGRGRK